MQKMLDILTQVDLFRKVEGGDLPAILSCLGARTVRYPKETFVLMAGEPVEHIGIILEGAAHITKESAEGERTIIAALSAGDYFAEALCWAEVDESPVSVVATADCAVLLLEFRHILHTCPNTCLFHRQIIENMLNIMARKNLFLQNRLEILTKKTLRLKILSYLETLAQQQGRQVTIPLNREELADFLSVDRSALSHELSRMKREGVIDYRKNHFILPG